MGQSSIFSLRAVREGNDSVILSKAELQAGIIGSCLTAAHNQGLVSCIWSAVPRLPSPQSQTSRAPSLCPQTLPLARAGAKERCGSLGSACARRHICASRHPELVEPCSQKARFPTGRHCCAPPAVLPPLPYVLTPGLSAATLEVSWHCDRFCSISITFSFQSLTATPNQTPLR